MNYSAWRKIQANPKECKVCGNVRPIFSKGRCLGCYRRSAAIEAAKNPKPRKAIPKVSKKQSIAYKAYKDARRRYLTEHPKCEFFRCESTAEDLHHKAGRGLLTADSTYFMSVCRKHHDYIHNHPQEAEKLGYWIPGSKRKFLNQ